MSHERLSPPIFYVLFTAKFREQTLWLIGMFSHGERFLLVDTLVQFLLVWFWIIFEFQQNLVLCLYLVRHGSVLDLFESEMIFYILMQQSSLPTTSDDLIPVASRQSSLQNECIICKRFET